MNQNSKQVPPTATICIELCSIQKEDPHSIFFRQRRAINFKPTKATKRPVCGGFVLSTTLDNTATGGVAVHVHQSLEDRILKAGGYYCPPIRLPSPFYTNIRTASSKADRQRRNHCTERGKNQSVREGARSTNAHVFRALHHLDQRGTVLDRLVGRYLARQVVGINRALGRNVINWP